MKTDNERLEKIKLLEGTFTNKQVELFDLILDKIDDVNYFGHLGTFGVSNGKILALYSNHLKENEKILAFDNKELTDDYKNTIINSIKKTSNMMLKDLCYESSNIYDFSFPNMVKSSYFYKNLKFLFINASKDGLDVKDMLEKADLLLSKDGIIAIKDWNNPLYFSLTEALFNYLAKHEDIKPLLIVENMIFLCRSCKVNYWNWLLTEPLKELYKEYKLVVPENGLSSNIILVTQDPIVGGSFRYL